VTEPTLFEPEADSDTITAQVRRYLGDCRRHRALLDPRYHPTEKGALMVVFHANDTQKAAVIAAYQQLTGF
jgi:hypothetical protein